MLHLRIEVKVYISVSVLVDMWNYYFDERCLLLFMLLSSINNKFQELKATCLRDVRRQMLCKTSSLAPTDILSRLYVIKTYEYELVVLYVLENLQYVC